VIEEIIKTEMPDLEVYNVLSSEHLNRDGERVCRIVVEYGCQSAPLDSSAMLRVTDRLVECLSKDPSAGFPVVSFICTQEDGLPVAAE
jgi:hypothetical protein